jgi:hypothetical protein
MCAEGAYKVYKSECAIRCPEHYIKDDVNHICSFDMSLLNHTVPPSQPENQGCMDGYYYSWAKKNCKPCDFSCLTCEIDEKYCTSCPNGRYLTDDHKCQTCEDFWKDDMVVGSSGACLENLSDG